MTFYGAWNYLNNHCIFEQILPSHLDDEYTYSDNRFLDCIDIEVVKVNPETNAIDDDKTLNTKVQVWLEAGPYHKDCSTHDIDLDCGNDTFELAIIDLAKLVKEKYGNNKTIAMKKVYEQYYDDY